MTVHLGPFGWAERAEQIYAEPVTGLRAIAGVKFRHSSCPGNRCLPERPGAHGHPALRTRLGNARQVTGRGTSGMIPEQPALPCLLTRLARAERFSGSRHRSPLAPFRPPGGEGYWLRVSGPDRHGDLKDTAQSRPPEKIRRKNRNTFRMSRKIDAASKGAELMSWDRRSRWKSNMVKAAKIARPSSE